MDIGVSERGQRTFVKNRPKINLIFAGQNPLCPGDKVLRCLLRRCEIWRGILYTVSTCFCQKILSAMYMKHQMDATLVICYVEIHCVFIFFPCTVHSTLSQRLWSQNDQLVWFFEHILEKIINSDHTIHGMSIIMRNKSQAMHKFDGTRF